MTTDLDGYDVVVAPLLHLVKGDLPSRLRSLVERGGTLLTTFLSARVDEDDNAFLTDAPGPLRTCWACGSRRPTRSSRRWSTR